MPALTHAGYGLALISSAICLAVSGSVLSLTVLMIKKNNAPTMQKTIAGRKISMALFSVGIIGLFLSLASQRFELAIVGIPLFVVKNALALAGLLFFLFKKN